MKIIIILLIISLFCSTSKDREKRRKAEMSRITREQIEQRRLLVEQTRREAKMRQEQERIAKEQERQAVILAKHEEQIAKLTFRMERAEHDIDALTERLQNLCAKRDNYMAQQAACTPMSKDWDKWQTKIISLDNQIHSAEARLAKAEFIREQAQQKLSA